MLKNPTFHNLHQVGVAGVASYGNACQSLQDTLVYVTFGPTILLYIVSSLWDIFFKESSPKILTLRMCILAACTVAAPFIVLLRFAGYGSVLSALKQQRKRLDYVGC